MPNNDILVEVYKAKIEKILNEIPLAKPKIEYVDSVYLHAREIGKRAIMEDDIAFCIPKENLIVIQKRISQAKKESILTGIDLVISFLSVKPFVSSSAKKVLDTEEKFVEHTVRHEIAHLRGIIPESEADVFAFEEMGKKTVLRIRI